jgi:hypothetical protein
MSDLVDLYFYACRLIKQKLVTKMTGASFPVIFVKVSTGCSLSYAIK